jgi:hypothetical protein
VLSFRESFFIVSLEELIEHKIKTVAEELIRKSHNELNQKFNSRQKQIREYVDGQIQNNEEKRSSFSAIDQSGSFQGGGDLFGRV